MVEGVKYEPGNRKYNFTGNAGGVFVALWNPRESLGQGAAKTVSHLLSEIQNGDCELVEENNGLIRRVHVVNLSVSAQFDGKIHTLIEDRQVFNEGTSQERIRKRRDLGGAVSEKIHSSEDPDAAVPRAIHEELGIEGNVNFNKTRSEDIDRDSPSFPGLRTQYRAHYYSATLTGDQIHKKGYKEVQPDKTTYFVWGL